MNGMAYSIRLLGNDVDTERAAAFYRHFGFTEPLAPIKDLLAFALRDTFTNPSPDIHSKSWLEILRVRHRAAPPTRGARTVHPTG